MKGIKHFFLRECKEHGVSVKVGNKWQCHGDNIVVPEQKTDQDVFFGFHELAHAVLHKDDKRNYDDLKSRIDIELEADKWAHERMQFHKTPCKINIATLGLIALYLHEGGTMENYSIKLENRFVILYYFGFELYSNFISNLPVHPPLY